MRDPSELIARFFTAVLFKKKRCKVFLQSQTPTNDLFLNSITPNNNLFLKSEDNCNGKR